MEPPDPPIRVTRPMSDFMRQCLERTLNYPIGQDEITHVERRDGRAGPVARIQTLRHPQFPGLAIWDARIIPTAERAKLEHWRVILDRVLPDTPTGQIYVKGIRRL